MKMKNEFVIVEKFRGKHNHYTIRLGHGSFDILRVKVLTGKHKGSHALVTFGKNIDINNVDDRAKSTMCRFKVEDM